MRWLGKLCNTIGNSFDQKGQYARADRFYAWAVRFCPTNGPAWFNRGLMAKFRRDWQSCRDFNQRAVACAPDLLAAWWNLGIAATALNDFVEADRAWAGYGIAVPPGAGERNWNLGSVPIRIRPEGPAEVVWCDRLDPARARIRNIPLPDSERAWGDVLLTDGAPTGERLRAGQKVSVFNELQLLTPSLWVTWGTRAILPGPDDWDDLKQLAAPSPVQVEDWSDLEVLCKACSEGTPHAHDEHDLAMRPWQTERDLGLACLSMEPVTELLETWKARGNGRSHSGAQRLFAHA